MIPPVSVDDADNIRKFIASMGGVSRTTNSTTSRGMDTSALNTPATGNDSGDHIDSDGSAKLASGHSSPPVTLVHDTQSPLARGILAPPPTPEVSLGDTGSGQVVQDSMAGLPTTFTLGDSRYAPKNSSKLSGARPTVPPGVYVSSSPKAQAISSEDRNAHNMSFPRMSFAASEPPRRSIFGLMPKTASAGSEVPSATDNEMTSQRQSTATNVPSTEPCVKNEIKEENHATNEPVLVSADPHEVKGKSFATHTPYPRSRSRQELKEKERVVQTEAQTYLQGFKDEKAVTEDSVSKSQSTLPHLRAIKTASAPPSLMDAEVPSSDELDNTAKENTPPASHAKLTLNGSTTPEASRTYTVDTMKRLANQNPSKGTSSTQFAKKGEDRKTALIFDSWPSVEKRDQPAARTRKVTLTGLPPASSPVFVTSLVFGGPLEDIHLAGSSSAIVHFLNPDDATKFYKGTANGLDCQKEGVKYVVLTEMDGASVDVVGGKLRQWIDSGMTRCIRAIGVDTDMSLGKLYGLAEAKGRKVEVIEVGENPGGLRAVTFRFMKIDHAVEFKASITRLDEWEHCNIHFAPDPCAK